MYLGVGRGCLLHIGRGSSLHGKGFVVVAVVSIVVLSQDLVQAVAKPCAPTYQFRTSPMTTVTAEHSDKSPYNICIFVGKSKIHRIENCLILAVSKNCFRSQDKLRVLEYVVGLRQFQS
jgi:hypothetical protein